MAPRNPFIFDETLARLVWADLETASPKGAVLLLGEPGIGKTCWVDALAENHDTKSFHLACNTLGDRCDLMGTRTVKKDDGSYTQVFFPCSTVTEAVAYAKKHPKEHPVLFLDEVNRTNADITSAILTIITDRRVGDVDLPENLFIIAAGNDRGNIVPLDEASWTRFACYHVGPDLATFFSVNPDLNPHVRAVLEKEPSLLFCRPVPQGALADTANEEAEAGYTVDDLLDEELSEGGYRQLTTPRTITALSKVLNELTQEDLNVLSQTSYDSAGESRTMLEAVIAAHVGDTPFAASLNVAINEALNQSLVSEATIQLTKPASWDALASQTTVDALRRLLATMPDKALMDCLIYAITRKNDQTTIVKNITSRLNERLAEEGGKTANVFGQSSMFTIMSIANTQSFDRQNVLAISQAVPCQGQDLWTNLRLIFNE